MAVTAIKRWPCIFLYTLFTVFIVSEFTISHRFAHADENTPTCNTETLAKIRKRFKAAVHESVISCHRSKGPHTTAQFETALAEKKARIRRRIGNKTAAKIQSHEEDLWLQLGEWAIETSQENNVQVGYLFDAVYKHSSQYKTCGAKLYTLASSKNDWTPRESRIVLSAIKCLQKGSDVYGQDFKSLEKAVDEKRKTDAKGKQKNYRIDRAHVTQFFNDLKELAYLTRCTEQRQRRDHVIAELKACKERIPVNTDGDPIDNSSVPDCVPQNTAPTAPAGSETLQQTGEKLSQ